jgi:PhnB protein
MTSFNIYLSFDGNCEEAFIFYQSIFGGNFVHVGRYKDMPSDADYQVSEKEGEKIMHISYRISDHAILMGCDTGGEWASNFSQGNNFSVSIQADSKEDADKFFNGLSKDGEITMPIANTFWESYFGMFTDKFGIQWMVSFDEQNK